MENARKLDDPVQNSVLDILPPATKILPMYRFRFFWILFKSLFSKPKPIRSIFELKFRVLPFLDTDFSRMFTHTYSAFMALGRWHYVFDSELRRVAIRNKWAPVTTSETMTYKKSIKAFSKVTLQTKLIAWNEHRFYLEQTFLVKGQIRAQCLLEGLIRAPQSILKPGDVFAAAGMNEASPEFPKHLKNG